MIIYSPDGIFRMDNSSLLGQYKQLVVEARLGRESDVLLRTEQEIRRRMQQPQYGEEYGRG